MSDSIEKIVAEMRATAKATSAERMAPIYAEWADRISALGGGCTTRLAVLELDIDSLIGAVACDGSKGGAVAETIKRRIADARREEALRREEWEKANASCSYQDCNCEAGELPACADNPATLRQVPEAAPSEQVMTLAERIGFLEMECGSLRRAGEITGVDPAYLSRLKRGEKDAPSEETLRKLGLVRRVGYAIAPKTSRQKSVRVGFSSQGEPMFANVPDNPAPPTSGTSPFTCDECGKVECCPEFHDEATPAQAGAYPQGSDREVLNYLMQQFDAENWECRRCGHSEDCATMDSAIYLREYLAKHPAQAGAELPRTYSALLEIQPQQATHSVAYAGPVAVCLADDVQAYADSLARRGGS